MEVEGREAGVLDQAVHGGVEVGRENGQEEAKDTFTDLHSSLRKFDVSLGDLVADSCKWESLI